MKNYSSQMAMDFWYNYDNFFLWKANDLVKQQIGNLFAKGETYLYSQFENSIKSSTFPAAYITAATPYTEELNHLFKEQDVLLTKHFGTSEINQQQAFEEFGQGILYDTRRETAFYDFWPIHSMDANYEKGQPPIGYYTWYSFLRAYTLLNGITDGKWLNLARHIALSAAIQEFMKPRNIKGGVHSNPNNPRIAPDKLTEFRQTYLRMGFTALDQAFTYDNALGPRPQN